MSRRRAARQQEKEEFLQQNPELRKINTRIEVEPPEVILDGENVLEEDDGFDVRVTIDGQPLPEAGISGEDNFSGFTLVNEISVVPIVQITAIEGFDLLELLNGFDEEPVPAEISLSAAGFGVASSGEEFEDDNEDNGDEGNEPCDDDDSDHGAPVMVPDGIDGISEGEALTFFAPFLESLGIDFTVTGQGSVVITFAGPGGPDGEVVSESFVIPRGTQPDDILNFEVDVDGDDFFFGAAIHTTGSAEISIVGIDLETPFEALLGA